MRVTLDHGHSGMDFDLADDRFVGPLTLGDDSPLKDTSAAIATALERPIGAPPLRELAKGCHDACILIRDITRPVPNKVVLALRAKDELEVALERRTAEYWPKAIHEAGVPVRPLLNVAESAEHPQTKARNMQIEAGGVRTTGNPGKISGYDDPPIRVGAPTLNQHGDALRREFAVSSNR